MEGISRPAGAGPTVDFGGEKLQVSGRILRHYAEIEAQIVHLRGNPFDLIRENKDLLADQPELMDRFVDRAFEEAKAWRFVTPHEFSSWLGTWPGICFTLWLAFRDNDREKYTLNKITEMFSDQYEQLANSTGGSVAADRWKETLTEAINQASGEDELGNSTGGHPSTAKAVTTSESTGD